MSMKYTPSPDPSAEHLPHVVCCLTRPDVEREVLASVGTRASVTVLCNRSAVRATVTRNAAVLVLVEIVDAIGSRLSSLLIAHWRDVLDIPVIAVLRPTPPEVSHIAETVRAGIDDIIILGIDDVQERIMRVLRERESNAARSFRDILSGAVDTDTLDLIEACVREAGQGNAHGLARSAGVSERTLARRFALLGLPAPATILRWVRVLLILRDLGHVSHSVEQAAKQYGYSSHTAFATALRQLTGMSTTEARAPSGYQGTLAAFETMLQRARSDCSAISGGTRDAVAR